MPALPAHRCWCWIIAKTQRVCVHQPLQVGEHYSRLTAAVISAQWPSLLKPCSPMLASLPPLVLERYQACQTVCFCGVFPEIKRAWASVDNSLFLWRFDRW